MIKFKNIDKLQFCNIIYNRIKQSTLIDKKIDKNHIVSIVSILFEEMLLDLSSGKKFNIGNFGKFFIKKMKPRKFFNVTQMKVTESVGNKILKFKFSQQNRRKILDSIDVEKTFGNK
jgi:nucleoid DNA-binding protein